MQGIICFTYSGAGPRVAIAVEKGGFTVREF